MLKKLTLALTLASAAFLPAAADEVVVDGIKYITDASTHTATVTYHIASDSGSTSDNANYYVGHVTVPETITVENEIYTVTSIGERAFRTCDKLTGVTLPNTITSIGSCGFEHCATLTEIYLTESVKTVGDWAFANCPTLEKMAMTGVHSIGEYSFYRCAALHTINMPVLTTMGAYAFADCAALQILGELSKLTNIGVRAFSGCTSLQTLCDMPSVTVIGGNAFDGCRELQSLGNMPELTVICHHAFSGCTALQSIGNMPKLNTICNDAFHGYADYYTETDPISVSSCTALQSVGDMPALAVIEYAAFNGCTALRTIGNMPELTTIGDKVFENCVALQTLGDTPTLTSIGNLAFSGCKSLKELGDLSGLSIIRKRAFSYCSALQTLGDMPALTTIQDGAFSYCSALQTPGKTPALATIGDEAFLNCTSLQTLGELPSLTTIGAQAFRNVGILDLYLPATVSNVYTSAFSVPTIVHFSVSNPPAFTGSFIATTICVPPGSIEAYREALPDMVASYIIVDGLTDYDVTVSALENDSDVLNKVNEGSDRDMALNVVNLKVSGTINSYDIIVFRNKMVNLKTLDLRDATIVGSSYEYLAGCHTTDNIVGKDMLKELRLTELILPDNAVSIEQDAIKNCSYLTSAVLPKELQTIGQGAFYNCTRLTNVIIPEHVTTISGGAFCNCSALTDIKIPDKVTYIGWRAFQSCKNLKNLTLSQSLTTIGNGSWYSDGAFWGCSSLEEIVLPPALTSIPAGCFYGCSSLKSVSMLPTLSSIGEQAFAGCNALTEFRIPAGISSIGNSAIPSTVRDVYTYTIQPTSITQETFGSATYLNATLHVPETSEKLYYWDTQWSQFQTIENFNEPYSYFYLEDKDLVEDPDTPRIDGETDENGDKKNPDADLGKDSGLIVDGDNSQDLGNVDVEHDGTGTGATIIGGDSGTSGTGGNINVDMLTFKIPVLAKKWYFFAFPFDIAMENIKFNGQMVWRYYDGEWRALHGSGSWKNVKDGKLERGKGYIFQGSKAGTLTLSIPNATFDAKNWIQELKQYVADAAQDASWNFIGNPFQSFYELADLGFDGPITCWNPNTNSYEAYSPLDDDLAMYPFMAFFVQKPEGVDDVEFDSKHRETKNQKNDPNHRAKARKRRMARSPRTTERVLVNLTVTDGTNSDRTRVVFNSRASEAYEVGVDASKFVSADAPQIYSLDSRNVRYSINERPAGDGTVRLGFYAPAAGTFTIECTRTDCPATLYDAETGKTVTLEAGDAYEFTAKKGYDDGRFVLNAKGADVTSIEGVKATESADSDFYGINGVRTDGSRKGVMIEVKGKEAKKVIRK